jgi:hypothetical protein
MKRIILGGVLGGIAMFLWEGLAHEVLPLGEAGVKMLSHEPPVLAALKENVKEPGFYIFPGFDQPPGMTSEQKQQAMQKAMDKARAGPAGLMVVHPEGTDYAMGKLLGMQCVFDVVTMLLAAFLVAWSAPLKAYGSRLIFVAVLGLLPTLAVHLPQWNWYRFPVAYTMAQFVVHLVGFAIGGLIVAAMVRPARYI